VLVADLRERFEAAIGPIRNIGGVRCFLVRGRGRIAARPGFSEILAV
jgi:hypothetical protein